MQYYTMLLGEMNRAEPYSVVCDALFVLMQTLRCFSVAVRSHNSCPRLHLDQAA